MQQATRRNRLLLLLLFLLSAGSLAEVLPLRDTPVPGLLKYSEQSRYFPLDHRVRGLHDSHWLASDLRLSSKTVFSQDEIRILSESSWVIWTRRPKILEQITSCSLREDPWGLQGSRTFPGSLSRDLMDREEYLRRKIRDRRRETMLKKAAQTRQELVGQEKRGSWADFDIPIKLPASIERVVGRGEKSNITVTGRQSISFGGTSTITNKPLTDESGRGQDLFPRLEMKQDLSIKLSGTVGEKVHVEVESHGEQLSSKAQNIRLRYEGEDDEVIQLIEMGDTHLTLPTAGLITYSASNKGLFGIKLLGNLGNLEFTAIASKQESEMSSRTFNNTGQVVQSDYVLDTQFLANQFFYLDHPGSAETYYHWIVDEATLNVFLEDFVPPSPQGEIQYAGYALVDSLGDGLADGGEGHDLSFGSFRLLTLGTDYILRLDPEQNFVALELNYPIQESDILAVSYVAHHSETGDSLHVGTVDLSTSEGWFTENPDTLALELIKPENFLPESPTWDYMFRNVYSLGGRNLDYNTLEVEVHRVSTRPDPSHPEGDTTPYLRIFGLDQYYGTGSSSEGHDGKVDQVWVDESRGLLFFPYVNPFDPPEELVYDWTSTGVDSFFLAEESDDRNPYLYEIGRRDLLKDPAYNRYLIRYSSATVSSRFNLNAFDIMEGSELVTLDGQTLSKNTDYRIDYFSGEVELIGDAASRLTPDSNISITYQYKPIFGGGKSSLVGLHGNYQFGKNGRVASSWLYEARYSGSRRPRLGEESTRNVVGNLLGNYQMEPEFLTRAMNYLPRVDTDAASSLKISGEIAVSFPNPNVDDHAYLDDMEGIEDADDLSLSRSLWMEASEPVDWIPNIGGADIPVLPENRAQAAYWLHPQQTTFRRDFNLSLPDQESRETVDVLRLEIPVNLKQDQISVWPALQEVNDANVALGDSLWCGLMQGFSGEGLDLSEAEYLEIWVNDFQQDSTLRYGTLHFDMGDLSEDFFEPEKNEFNTEDRINRGTFDEIDEDTGLDGSYDSSEEGMESPWADENDPAGDNYDASVQSESYAYSYFKVNGREKNRRLDTEDLDKDGQLDVKDSYFTLAVDLDETPLIDMVSVYDEETASLPEASKAWRLYRLKLTDAGIRSDGASEPDWSRVKYFRFWVEGMNELAASEPFNTLEIASIKIVGNRWKNHAIQSSEDGVSLEPESWGPGEDFRVEVVNTKDNATFTWPYETIIDPETGLPEREQALNFVYERILPGHQVLIRKDYQALNLLGYRSVSFYLHPDDEALGHDFFVRAAFDSLNYYELQHRPDSPGWRELNISMTDWTDMKLFSAEDTVMSVVGDLNVPGREYILRKVGSPDLSRVKALYFGIRNTSETEELNGEAWINDIRVRDVRRDVGYAGKVNASANLANVLNIGANFQETDPEFRGLRATQGSGQRNRNWGVNVSTDLQHFLPLFGYRMPVSVNRSFSSSTPKYEPGSDVEITDSGKRRESTSVTETQGFSVNLSRKPSQNWFMRVFLDNLKLNASLSQRKSEGPYRVDWQEGVNHTISWQGNFKERELPLPLGARLRWSPQSLNLSSKTRRSSQKNWTAIGERYSRNPDVTSGSMNNNFSFNWNLFPSLRGNFSMSDSRDLEHELAQRVDLGGVELNLGFQKSQSQGLTLDYTLPFFRKFRPKLNFRSSYSQSVPSFSGIGGSSAREDALNIQNTNNLSTNYNLDVGRWIQKVTGTSSAAKSPSQSMPATVQPKRLPSHVLVPVDPLRGPDPRALKRVTRRWIEEQEEELALTEAPADSLQNLKDPLYLAKKAFALLGGIKPIKVDLSRRLVSSFNNVTGSADPLYRLGFIESPGLPGYGSEGELLELKEADQQDETRDFRMSSGINLWSKVQISTNFDWSRTDKDSRSSRSINRRWTWPSFSVELSSVEKWPLWGNLMDCSSLGFGFKSTLTETDNLGTGLQTRSVGRVFTPHWNISWKNRMRSNLTVSYQSTENGQNTQTTRNRNFTAGVDFNYSLSSSSGKRFLGLTWMPAFQSRLDMRAALKYTRVSNVRVSSDDFTEPLGGSSTWSFSPGANYRFSDKLTGGATLNFSRSYWVLTGEKKTGLGLTLTSTLIF
ncbi:MAG: cell surface protein SprA [Candidatus Krumholzibacteria bacterium]|nr:cell surface protein SprA [Candidatus Krumholzibacteria bacterium]